MSVPTVKMEFTPVEICELIEAVDFYRSMNDNAADDYFGNLQSIQDKLMNVEIRPDVKARDVVGRTLRFRSTKKVGW